MDHQEIHIVLETHWNCHLNTCNVNSVCKKGINVICIIIHHLNIYSIFLFELSLITSFLSIYMFLTWLSYHIIANKVNCQKF